MSKFQDNLSVIPRGAKVTAWIISLGVAALVSVLPRIPPNDNEHLPLAVRVLLPILSFTVLFVIIMLDGYVYGDARRRGMRYVMWTLLAIFVPDAIGVILYFILRDPMPVSCPSCSASVLSKFTFCPSCGTSVKPVCSNCGKPVEIAWSNCAHCGSKLPSTPQRAA
jgi:hypothetical protein